MYHEEQFVHHHQLFFANFFDYLKRSFLSRFQAEPPKSLVYTALYDYTAADDDEVSFSEGTHWA